MSEGSETPLASKSCHIDTRDTWRAEIVLFRAHTVLNWTHVICSEAKVRNLELDITLHFPCAVDYLPTSIEKGRGSTDLLHCFRILDGIMRLGPNLEPNNVVPFPIVLDTLSITIRFYPTPLPPNTSPPVNCNFCPSWESPHVCEFWTAEDEAATVKELKDILETAGKDGLFEGKVHLLLLNCPKMEVYNYGISGHARKDSFMMAKTRYNELGFEWGRMDMQFLKSVKLRADSSFFPGTSQKKLDITREPIKADEDTSEVEDVELKQVKLQKREDNVISEACD